jgi:hypothetical protein
VACCSHDSRNHPQACRILILLAFKTTRSLSLDHVNLSLSLGSSATVLEAEFEVVKTVCTSTGCQDELGVPPVSDMLQAKQLLCLEITRRGHSENPLQVQDTQICKCPSSHPISTAGIPPSPHFSTPLPIILLVVTLAPIYTFLEIDSLTSPGAPSDEHHLTTTISATQSS